MNLLGLCTGRIISENETNETVYKKKVAVVLDIMLVLCYHIAIC